MKKIEWLEDVKIGKDQKIAETTDFVNDEEYQVYVNELGWAKDAETGEHGERKPGAHKLGVNSVKTPIKK